ncbi:MULTISPECIES: metal-sensitive transcriptional regulator [unclassified Arthrobacter]|uniref:metal-sensitive transcriptional regulator n=1 Tax=unclassified Arthrobacter TaxID=235627 RepID=UPI002DFFCFC2|nr:MULTISPECIES: metal-sensitive transcriptional regulator [unclassified Arthrobacter]MEC5193374.1 DNA-binding FrmR family transcriptional regulator [Arthrobacter sp. MP_M4]MEC5204840.1 DNA-binding FrmR family transcriptional regulator [Arthrobacter sp. MP_M7]
MTSTVSLHQPLPGPDAGSRRTVNRLKRARGQLTALIDAVESGADCRNVVTQLSAVRGALDKAGFELISTAMRACLTEPADVLTSGREQDGMPGRKPTLEEIRALFLRLT